MSPSCPPRHRRPTLSHWLEYLSVCFGQFVMGRMPKRLHAPFARFLTFLWLHVMPIRRDTVLRNLEIAFPEKDAKWRWKTAGDCHAHFVRMLGFDSVALRRGGMRALRELAADELPGNGFDKIAAFLEKPCIVLSAHFGNWELPTSYCAAVKGFRLTAVAKPMHNPLMEEAIAKGRRAFGWNAISTRGDPIRSIIKAIRNGETILMLADQDARHDGVFVPFFSKPASTPPGAATLAYRFKMPLIVVLCERSAEDDRYHLRVFPPIEPNPEANRKDEVQRMTAEYLACLESAVRETPGQYFWFHNRWKTRPKDEKAREAV